MIVQATPKNRFGFFQETSPASLDIKNRKDRKTDFITPHLHEDPEQKAIFIEAIANYFCETETKPKVVEVVEEDHVNNIDSITDELEKDFFIIEEETIDDIIDDFVLLELDDTKKGLLTDICKYAGEISKEKKEKENGDDSEDNENDSDIDNFYIIERGEDEYDEDDDISVINSEPSQLDIDDFLLTRPLIINDDGDEKDNNHDEDIIDDIELPKTRSVLCEILWKVPGYVLGFIAGYLTAPAAYLTAEAGVENLRDNSLAQALHLPLGDAIKMQSMSWSYILNFTLMAYNVNNVYQQSGNIVRELFKKGVWKWYALVMAACGGSAVSAAQIAYDNSGSGFDFASNFFFNFLLMLSYAIPLTNSVLASSEKKQSLELFKKVNYHLSMYSSDKQYQLLIDTGALSTLSQLNLIGFTEDYNDLVKQFKTLSAEEKARFVTIIAAKLEIEPIKHRYWLSGIIYAGAGLSLLACLPNFSKLVQGGLSVINMVYSWVTGHAGDTSHNILDDGFSGASMFQVVSLVLASVFALFTFPAKSAQYLDAAIGTLGQLPLLKEWLVYLKKPGTKFADAYAFLFNVDKDNSNCFKSFKSAAGYLSSFLIVFVGSLLACYFIYMTGMGYGGKVALNWASDGTTIFSYVFDKLGDTISSAIADFFWIDGQVVAGAINCKASYNFVWTLMTDVITLSQQAMSSCRSFPAQHDKEDLPKAIGGFCSQLQRCYTENEDDKTLNDIFKVISEALKSDDIHQSLEDAVLQTQPLPLATINC